MSLNGICRRRYALYHGHCLVSAVLRPQMTSDVHVLRSSATAIRDANAPQGGRYGCGTAFPQANIARNQISPLPNVRSEAHRRSRKEDVILGDRRYQAVHSLRGAPVLILVLVAIPLDVQTYTCPPQDRRCR